MESYVEYKIQGMNFKVMNPAKGQKCVILNDCYLMRL